MSLRLFLVRHGESEWNRSSRYAGQRDVPLSERGREQARRVARKLAAEHFAAIYASPLHRARETAAIIASEIGLPLVLDAGLQEIHHGAWQGKTTAEVASQFPCEYALWQAHPHAVRMPGGESLLQVAERVQTSLERMQVQRRDGSLVICAHDAVLRVIMLNCLEMGLEHFWKLHVENASLSLLERQNRDGSWHLASLNDTSHLAGICSEYALQAL